VSGTGLLLVVVVLLVVLALLMLLDALPDCPLCAASTHGKQSQAVVCASCD
jgi:hypothetical protein